MKRMLFVLDLLLFALVIWLLTPLANAQVCPSWVDQISCLQQDAYNIVGNARRQNRANQAVANLENLIFRNGNYGYYGDGGVFIPTHDRNRRPIGKREGTAIGAGIGAAIGGGIGSLIGRGHPGAGTAFGAGGGALLGLVLSGRGSNDSQLNCSKRKLNRKEQEMCSAIAAERAQAEYEVQAHADYEVLMRTGMKVYNRTGFPVDILDGNQMVVNLRRGQTATLPEAREGYRAEMLVPDRSMPGRIERVEAEFRLANDRSGWVFTAPDGGGV